MDYNNYLLKEYEKLGKKPQYYDLCGKKLMVPASYGNIEDFIDNFLAFQDKESFKYESYNKRNPDKQIYEREIKVNNDIRIIVPLSMAKRNLSDKEIVKRTMKKAINRYYDAIEKTSRLNKENIKEKALVSLSEAHFSHCHKEHAKFVTKKIATKIGKTLKWSAKQTADVAIGLAGSPIFAAYKLLDKKYHWEENKFSHFLDKQIAPKIKKALLTTAITSAVVLGGKYSKNISQFAEDVKMERAEREAQAIKNQQEKEAFFKKYDTTDEVFYQNYKTAKENEAMIVALIACPEEFRENAYLCEAGKLTIGYGTTRTVLRDNDGNILRDDKGFAITRAVKKGDVTTKEAAYEDVVAHLDKYVYAQFKHINRVLEDQEIAAICMFIYNTDEGAFNKSMLCMAINSNASDEKVREAFSIIRSVNGNRSYGLINRHGFEGYVFCCKNMEDLINLKPTIAGSPDIKYYEYGKYSKKDPLENIDETFVVRDIEKVAKDAEKFKTNNFKKCIVYMLPQEKAKEVLEKFGIKLDENGKIKTDISWEEAQEISSKHNKKSAKKLKLRKNKSR